MRSKSGPQSLTRRNKALAWNIPNSGIVNTVKTTNFTKVQVVQIQCLDSSHYGEMQAMKPRLKVLKCLKMEPYLASYIPMGLQKMLAVQFTLSFVLCLWFKYIWNSQHKSVKMMVFSMVSVWNHKSFLWKRGANLSSDFSKTVTDSSVNLGFIWVCKEIHSWFLEKYSYNCKALSWLRGCQWEFCQWLLWS